MWSWRSTGCLERSRSVWRRDLGRTEVCDWRSVRGGSRLISDNRLGCSGVPDVPHAVTR